MDLPCVDAVWSAIGWGPAAHRTRTGVTGWVSKW